MTQTVNCQWCGTVTPVNEKGTSGTLSGNCPNCGAQSFLRSPKGVSAFRAKHPAPAPAAGKEKSKEADDKPFGDLMP